MEFGAEFDEDLFGDTKTTKTRSANVTRAYKAKICEPMWFENDIEYEDTADQIQHYVYRGDSLYYRGDFDEALFYYELARSSISPSNLALKRLLQESIARCHMNCARHSEAQSMAKQLFEESNYLEQKTSAYNLLVTVYHAAGKTQDEQKALQQLITLQSSNSVLWMKLANSYLVLSRNLPANKHSCMHTDGEKDEMETGQRLDAVELSVGVGLHRHSQQQCSEGNMDLTGLGQRSESAAVSCGECQVDSDTGVLSRTDCVCHKEVDDMKGTGVNESLDEESLREWISTNNLEKETVHCKLCCVGCLLMTRLLLFHIQNTVVSFSETKHKQLSKEVAEKLQGFCLPDKLLQNILHLTKCVLYGSDSEEESFGDGNQIPSDLAQRTPLQFEQKWFPWLPTCL